MDLTFCQKNAKSILEASPVAYIKGVELHGSLFDKDCTTGAISLVFTNFYLDHAEPFEALAQYEHQGKWILGRLLDGYEYLIILPTK